MACCVIAAFLIARFVAMLRRWGMFRGVVRVPEGETVDTAFSTASAWLARPAVRGAVMAALAVELTLGGAWLCTRHGAHIAQEADIAWSWLHGERVIYAGVCTPNGGVRSTRLVLTAAGPADRAG